ncbi:MAG: hypothetical protein ICV81_04495 [Flavisolibacter sp.]|nr:hypothetical protein [Flavisolibacter sp.]
MNRITKAFDNRGETSAEKCMVIYKGYFYFVVHNKYDRKDKLAPAIRSVLKNLYWVYQSEQFIISNLTNLFLQTFIVMQTLIVQITDNTALKVLHNLEEKQLIKIVGDNTFDSPSLAGAPLRIEAAEEAPNKDLKEIQTKWQRKRKKLQKRIR